MTIEEVVYNLKRLLTRSNITVESRFSDMQLVTLLSAARITVIAEITKDDKNIDNSLLQPLGMITLTGVDSIDQEIPEPEQGEDPIEPYYGIATIPDVHTFSGFKGLFVFTSDKKRTVELVDFNRFLAMIETNHPALEFSSIVSYLNKTIRVYPYLDKVYVLAILKNVLDGTETDVSNQTKILPGIEYKVVTGTITYFEEQEDGTVEEHEYEADDTFIGIQDYPVYTTADTTYLVQRVLTTYPVTFKSQFPANPDMIRRMTLLLLTQEFKLEKEVAADLILDMQDDTK